VELAEAPQARTQPRGVKPLDGAGADMAHEDTAGRSRVVAAAGGEEHASRRNRQGAKHGQPVHPIRRTPPYDESERYVRVKMFVPHASHFASTIWSAPLVERW